MNRTDHDAASFGEGCAEFYGEIYGRAVAPQRAITKYSRGITMIAASGGVFETQLFCE